MSKNTHSIPLGYILWLFGFTRAHRFYYGKPITGVIWFCTLGLLGVHRLYMRKYLTAVIWFFTGGLFLVGYLYDFLTLNDQIHEIDR